MFEQFRCSHDYYLDPNRFDSRWAHCPVSVSGLPREDQTWARTWRTCPKVFDLPTYRHIWKVSRFVEDGLPIRCCDLLELTLDFEARDLNSVIQQAVRSGIVRNWGRRKLHLSKTACANRSSELPCLSASNCIRHRAKKDFRHQEMDSLVLWSMQHAFTTLNNLWEQ